jgi:hypothetical protein
MAPSVPDMSLPRLRCDFNACGWSGDAADDCYYAFDKQALATLDPSEGTRVFIYDDDGDGTVIGCEGLLERYQRDWRIRPVKGTWFEGRLPGSAE